MHSDRVKRAGSKAKEAGLQRKQYESFLECYLQTSYGYTKS